MKITPELVVENVESSIDFYQNFLDFHLVDKVGNNDSCFWAKMESNDKSTEIMFVKTESVVDEIPEINNRRDAGKMILLVEVNDINTLYLKFKGKKFVLKDLYKTDYGTNEFVIRDIDGYILNISER